jgi:hypothetical protein
MGDMADWALEQLFDPDFEDYEDCSEEPIDGFDNVMRNDDGSITGPGHKKEKTCNRCGEPGLHWEQSDYGWRLHHASGLLHCCAAKHESPPPSTGMKILADYLVSRLKSHRDLQRDFESIASDDLSNRQGWKNRSKKHRRKADEIEAVLRKAGIEIKADE